MISIECERTVSRVWSNSYGQRQDVSRVSALKKANQTQSKYIKPQMPANPSISIEPITTVIDWLANKLDKRAFTAVRAGDRGHTQSDFISCPCGVNLTEEKNPEERKSQGSLGYWLTRLGCFPPCHRHSHFTYKSHILTGRFIEKLHWRNALTFLFLCYFVDQQEKIFSSLWTCLIFAVALNQGLLCY